MSILYNIHYIIIYYIYYFVIRQNIWHTVVRGTWKLWRPSVENVTFAPSCDIFNLGSSYFHVPLTTVRHLLIASQQSMTDGVCRLSSVRIRFCGSPISLAYVRLCVIPLFRIECITIIVDGVARGIRQHRESPVWRHCGLNMDDFAVVLVASVKAPRLHVEMHAALHASLHVASLKAL